jgi:hypothetical protein
MFTARWILNAYNIFLYKLIEMQLNSVLLKVNFVFYFTSVLYRNLHRPIIFR